MAIRSFWMALVGLLVSSQLFAATITVTTTADDITPNDGTVSLREAITAINAGTNLGDPDIIAQNPGTFGVNDTINFNIPGPGVHTINVGSFGLGSLPTITNPVFINGYSQPGASANTLANGDNGVLLIQLDGANAGPNADGLLVGAAGSKIAGLIINRFSLNGIELQVGGCTISGNFIGLNAAGTAEDGPNQNDGIHISNASNNVIGGTTPDARNVVSGNFVDGIHIVGTTAAPATGNLVEGNFVGTSVTGIDSVGLNPNLTPPAPAGNFLFGIEVSGGNANTIGGLTAAARNVVGFNVDGIAMDNGAENNVIQGNFIGVGADGVTPVGNALHGISLRSDDNLAPPLGPGQANEPAVSGNVIGLNPNTFLPGAGNVIEFNGTAGVAVFGNPLPNNATPIQNSGNSILGNSIFENGRSQPASFVGIDLSNGFVYPRDDGFTANDSKGHGAANNPNNFQNFPVLSSAINTGSSVQIVGSLTQSVSPNTTFRVEFFSSSPDPRLGAAEGQTLIGATSVVTNGSGVASFSVIFNVAVPAVDLVTATATNTTADPGSQASAVNVFNTSEFSVAIATVAPDYTVTIPSGSATVTAGQAASFTVTITPQAGFSSAVNFSCSGLPTDATCSFLPASLTPNGAAVNTNLSIATTVHILASTSPSPMPGVLASGLTGVGLLGLVMVGGTTRRKRVWQTVIMSMVVIAIVAGMAGCGGGHKLVPNPTTGTPAGTYTVTVTATSGTTSHTGTITLIVQ
jgi:CSLREA domain-containing protein